MKFNLIWGNVLINFRRNWKKTIKHFWKNTPKSAKNAVFCRFGDSAASTEASAEPIRSKTAEASAEASVSVVHYQWLRWSPATREIAGSSPGDAMPFCKKSWIFHDIRSLLHLVTWRFSEIRKWNEVLVHRDDVCQPKVILSVASLAHAFIEEI